MRTRIDNTQSLRQQTSKRSRTLERWLYIRKDCKYNNQGKSITLRLRYENRQVFGVTGVTVQSIEDWDPATKTIKGDPIGTSRLEQILARLTQIENQYRIACQPFDLEDIINKALGVHVEARGIPKVSELLRDFNKQMQLRFEVGDMKEHSLEKLVLWNRFIEEFVTKKYGYHGMIKQIVPGDSKNFELFLKQHYNHSHDYTQKIVEHLKRVLNYAVENEWITRNPFLNFRKKMFHQKGEYLTLAELEKLEKTTLFSPVLDRIRDAFIFLCWTGLSYKDAVSLTQKHIIETPEGDSYILQRRTKTGTGAMPYLTEKCRDILEKYREDTFCVSRGQLLPLPSNQKINTYLKQVAGMAGVDKNISCHTARRTYATILQAKGVEEQFIVAAMGHKNIATTKRHYIHQQPDPVIKELKAKLS